MNSAGPNRDNGLSPNTSSSVNHTTHTAAPRYNRRRTIPWPNGRLNSSYCRVSNCKCWVSVGNENAITHPRLWRRRRRTR